MEKDLTPWCPYVVLGIFIICGVLVIKSIRKFIKSKNIKISNLMILKTIFTFLLLISCILIGVLATMSPGNTVILAIDIAVFLGVSTGVMISAIEIDITIMSSATVLTLVAGAMVVGVIALTPIFAITNAIATIIAISIIFKVTTKKLKNGKIN